MRPALGANAAYKRRDILWLHGDKHIFSRGSDLGSGRARLNSELRRELINDSGIDIIYDDIAAPDLARGADTPEYGGGELARADKSEFHIITLHSENLYIYASARATPISRRTCSKSAWSEVYSVGEVTTLAIFSLTHSLPNFASARAK